MILSSGCEAPQLIHMYLPPYSIPVSQSLAYRMHMAYGIWQIGADRDRECRVACWRTVALNAATRDSQSVRLVPGSGRMCLTLFEVAVGNRATNFLTHCCVTAERPANHATPFLPHSTKFPLIWQEEGACQLHEPSQSYVMRLVCGLRGRETTEECCVTPRRTTTTRRIYKRIVELASWRWQRPHERKNRISNKTLTFRHNLMDYIRNRFQVMLKTQRII